MQKNKKIRKAVFPVGGLGTRFLPATKSLPKEMLPVASKPIIQYAFEEAVKAGIEQFIFITGRNKNAISNHFDHSYELQEILSQTDKARELSLTCDWMPEAGQIAFVRQQQPRGLGHAIYCARNLIGDEPFAILLADEMLMSATGFLKQMCEFYEDTGANIIAVHEVEKADVSSYGIINPLSTSGNKIKIKNMVEKPKVIDAPSNIAIVGRYILSPKIFDCLKDLKPSKYNGEIQLTDAMQLLIESQDFYGLKFDGPRFDCGNELGFLEANVAYSMEKDNNKDKIIKMLRKYVE